MSRHDDYKFIGDIGHEICEPEKVNNEIKERTPPCLKIILTIKSVPLLALIDSGSQITAISEEIYKYLLLHGKLTELPVSNVILFTAIGKKSTTIKKQILCEIEIGGQIIQSRFLIVPYLISQLILGNDRLL